MAKKLVGTEGLEPFLITISETQRLLGGCSRGTIYNMVDAGDLDFVRVRARPFLRLSQVRKIAGEEAA